VKNLEIWIPVVVAIVTSITTFIVAKGRNKKDMSVNDRKLLSEDERQFRADLKEIIGSYKKELEETRNELKESREEIGELREEIAKLHKLNLLLSLENQKLVLKVEELTELLTRVGNKDDNKNIEEMGNND
jgi:septal ring factor EnvC (AmiA/AmiB activator)